MDIDKAEKIGKMLCFLVRQTIDPKFTMSFGWQGTIAMWLDRFRKLYPYDFADDRVTDYVVYQIYRFRDLIPERGKGWNLTWCFSANAVDKFKKQFIDDNGKSGMNYYIDQWLQADGLDRGKLTEMLVDFREHRLAKFIYMPSEELTKKRFADTDTGFMLCMQATTGWSPLSAACQKCSHVEECIGYFEKKTPELIRLRKEYKTKNSKL